MGEEGGEVCVGEVDEDRLLHQGNFVGGGVGGGDIWSLVVVVCFIEY